LFLAVPQQQCACKNIAGGGTGFGVTCPQKYRLQDANHGRKMATSLQDQTPQKLVKHVLKTVENCYTTGGGRAGLQRVARSAQ